MSNKLSTLKLVLETLLNSSYEGVDGVIKFQGLNPGPCVGITICTHGNEPSGLAAASFLIEKLSVNPLQCGTLFLVLNNIEATKMYFAAETEEQQRKARYIDVNMNRLPNDVLELKKDTRYEVKRAQELNMIWKEFDIGLDIHSTTSPTDPMIISKGNEFNKISNLIRGFPMSVLISNIDSAQTTLPAFALYGQVESEIPVLAIETGQHTDHIAFSRSVDCVESLLQNLKMLPGTPKVKTNHFHEYIIDSSILFPNNTFDLVRNFKTYESVVAGELLAKDSIGTEIRAPHDGHLIFPTERRGEDKDISEEISFISRPVSQRSIS